MPTFWRFNESSTIVVGDTGLPIDCEECPCEEVDDWCCPDLEMPEELEIVFSFSEGDCPELAGPHILRRTPIIPWEPTGECDDDYDWISEPITVTYDVGEEHVLRIRVWCRPDSLPSEFSIALTSEDDCDQPATVPNGSGMARCCDPFRMTGESMAWIGGPTTTPCGGFLSGALINAVAIPAGYVYPPILYATLSDVALSCPPWDGVTIELNYNADATVYCFIDGTQTLPIYVSDPVDMGSGVSVRIMLTCGDSPGSPSSWAVRIIAADCSSEYDQSLSLGGGWEIETHDPYYFETTVWFFPSAVGDCDIIDATLVITE